MNILIAGAGRLGEQAAHLMAANGHQVTVIDHDATRLAALGRGPLRVVHGDACEPAVLETAGVLTADLLLALTGEDEDNLVVALLAKRQFGVRRVLARVNDPDNSWLFDGDWGVDVALPAATPLVSLIEEASGTAPTIGLARLAAGVSLVETRIDAGCGAAGATIDQLALPPGTVLAAVIHDGEPVVPTARYQLRSGDTVLVVTTTATEDDIDRAFGRSAGTRDRAG